MSLFINIQENQHLNNLKAVAEGSKVGFSNNFYSTNHRYTLSQENICALWSYPKKLKEMLLLSFYWF